MYVIIVISCCKRDNTAKGDNVAKKINKKLALKNNALFRSCISIINIIFIDNAENLETVMPMYNLAEYGNNYSMTSESFWNYYRDKVNDDANENNPTNNRINSNKTIGSKSFEYGTKLIGSTSNKDNILDAEIVVPL